MRVFTSNDFTGVYPVGAALVVVAEDETEARKIACYLCAEHDLTFDGTISELPLDGPHGRMLLDGDY